MSPLVSILIPCYNAEPWLADTLGSVLAQTWTHKEIIIVDDGSTDNSLSIAHSFEGAGIHVFQQDHLGAAAARNHAFRKSQGQFIQFLDADDLLGPDKIERQITSLLDQPGCIAACAWGRFYGTPENASFEKTPLWTDLAPIDWLVCSYGGGGMMPVMSWLVPRAVCEAAGPWDESFSLNDDGEYFSRVVLASKGIKFIPQARTYYRCGIPNSLSRAQNPIAWQSLFRSLQAATSRLLNAENSPRTRQASADSFQWFVYGAYPDYPDLVSKAEAIVRELGGSNARYGGGNVFRTLASIAGWKFARRVQKLAAPIRLSRLLGQGCTTQRM